MKKTPRKKPARAPQAVATLLHGPELKTDADLIDWLNNHPLLVCRSIGCFGDRGSWQYKDEDGFVHEAVDLRDAIQRAAASRACPVANREPYVKLGDLVTYIGSAKTRGFIGGCSVLSVGVWDGVGFPVRVSGNECGRTLFYDLDLADMRKELPERFWAVKEHRRLYPNVHTYVRVKRYGESIPEAIRRLGFASIDPSEWPKRPRSRRHSGKASR